MMNNIGDVFYRYDDVSYAAPLDEYENPSGPSTLRVVLSKYKVIKVTPKGVRLDIGCFVNASARKRYAYPTEAEALTGFIARKNRQLSIYNARVNQVEKALQIAENMKAGSPVNSSLMTNLIKLELPKLPGV